ncbi:ATPase [Sorangium cellulosum]|uniref:ATPase n=1 Tax=Sorangium cellulosum TaxID=56 RepID=A0A2L0EQ38_SORCE|nr:HAD-IC family P-type ATPase [Sorangium cellulosum]AUX41404.1 ATPase [Sorangium cellulosum]
MSQRVLPASAPITWHSLSASDALANVKSVEAGLSQEEAARRLQEVGPNVIQRAKGDSALKLLFRQINDPLIYVLLASAALAVAMGEAIDGAVVLAVVVLNTAIGFVQELRASKAIEALSGMVPQSATVVRGGARSAIPAADVVPGDVVVLEAGDKVPADARLLSVKNLAVDESALTGESVPSDKHTQPVAEDSGVGDRKNLVFGGTLVTRGTATAVVVATGGATELGRISSMLHEATEIETPLTRSMAKVGRVLTIAIVAVALLIVGIALLRGYPPVDAMLAGISLAVAAIPEGLPAIITISLAIGVQRMARRRAVIRKLPAVETLGSTAVICSDKTGTLTRNEMTVRALWTPATPTTPATSATPDSGGAAGEALEVTGVGYAPEGEVRRDGAPVGELPEAARALLRAGLLCNDARMTREGDTRGIEGDPTEGALVVAAQKLGVDVEETRRAYPRLDAVPFSSERQMMATLHEAPGGERVIFMKGAPEAVLGATTIGEAERAEVMAQVERMAAQGMRVLAAASRPFSDVAGAASLDEAHLTEGFALLGLEGMIDPPRPEAIDAIKACHEAGITVKMITGDHLATARAIGEQLGLVQGGARAMNGTELSRLSDEELRGAAAGTHVFARVAPEHKLRLVKALQADGKVVAMTGDGVNDAPALKQADIGVAMGITGTAVSKESADVVLTDDNFASIRAAVEEGRRVYDNLVKALAFVLPTNLGEALILLVAVMIFPIAGGVPLMPITAVQILWVNLVATVALSLPLAFEAMEKDVMSRPPRDPREPILSRFVLVRTAIVALLMTAGAIGVFLYEYFTEVRGGVVSDVAYREAQTAAVTTVVLFQIFYVINCRSLRDSLLTIGLFSNPWIYVGIGGLLALQLCFVYVPFMHTLFGSAPLPLDAWVKSTLVAMSILPVMSVERWWRLRRARRSAEGERQDAAPGVGGVAGAMPSGGGA